MFPDRKILHSLKSSQAIYAPRHEGFGVITSSRGDYGTIKPKPNAITSGKLNPKDDLDFKNPCLRKEGRTARQIKAGRTVNIATIEDVLSELNPLLCIDPQNP